LISPLFVRATETDEYESRQCGLLMAASQWKRKPAVRRCSLGNLRPVPRAAAPSGLSSPPAWSSRSPRGCCPRDSSAAAPPSFLRDWERISHVGPCTWRWGARRKRVPTSVVGLVVPPFAAQRRRAPEIPRLPLRGRCCSTAMLAFAPDSMRRRS
jgi:hypothetical protein